MKLKRFAAGILAAIFTGVFTFVAPSVDAATTYQNVFTSALQLTSAQKAQFVETIGHINAPADVTTYAHDVWNIVSGTAISEADVTTSLNKYAEQDSITRALARTAISQFNLVSDISNTSSFGDVVKKINERVTGSQTNNLGIRFFLTVLGQFNSNSSNSYFASAGLTVKDGTGLESNKIKVDYNHSDAGVDLAKTIFNQLVGYMGSLNSSLSGSDKFTSFISLMESDINSCSDSQIMEFKHFLNNNTPDLYSGSVTWTTNGSNGGTTTPNGGSSTPTGGTSTPTGGSSTPAGGASTPTSGTSTPASGTTPTNQEVEKALEKVGTTEVKAVENGTTATIAADAIKATDIVAKAKLVNDEAKKLNASVEKKVVISVPVSDKVANISASLSADVLKAVKDNGIDKIEIAAGNTKIAVAPDFIAGAAAAKAVTLEANKVAVTDDIKSKLSDKQKLILGSNPVIYDFNAAITSATGETSKVTNFDKPVTIKLKYDLKAGESKDTITVLYLADDGSIQNMIGKYDAVTGEVIFTTNHFSKFIIKNNTVSFGDVKTGSFGKTEIESIASKGIINAAPKFRPNDNITRAEFVKMLVIATGVLDTKATCDFKDVKKTDWSYIYVASAVKAGITNGVGNGKFGVTTNITKEQMAVMTANALKIAKSTGESISASDSDKVSSWAKAPIANCIKNGIITIGTDNTVDPKGLASRALCAVTVYRAFNFK